MAEAAPNPVAVPVADPVSDLFDPADSHGLAKRQMIPTPSVVPTGLRALTQLGCFSTGQPMIDHGPYTFQSKGNCQPICWLLEQPVMGLVNGTDCWCGSMAPPEENKVDDGLCNTPCGGIDTEFCGGDGMFTVYNTGWSRNAVQYLPVASLSSAGGAKTTSTAGPETVVVTQPPTSSSASSGGGGSNKVGIAVGVVVGVVAIVGIIAGALFWLRFKRRRDAEEEYKRQAAVNAFVNGGKGHNSASSINDSRLDPEILQGRRESTGTIADNQDYSRRILKVRNPDDF